MCKLLPARFRNCLTMKLKAIFLVICFTISLEKSKGAMPFKDQCLYWHNYFRKLHQVPPVTWSMSLQKEAEDWAKYLADNNKFHHSSKNPGNLYMQTFKAKEVCSDAIWWFHNEEKDYNYSNPKYYKAAGHFTMIVWKSTREIGAAWKYRKDGRVVLSIKYNPGGNVIGFFGKNVLPPTAQVLGPEWAQVPPKFARCPKEYVVTEPTGEAQLNMTVPYVEAAAGTVVSSLGLFIGSFIIAVLIS